MRRSVLLLLLLVQLIALGTFTSAERRHLADLKDGVADGVADDGDDGEQAEAPAMVSEEEGEPAADADDAFVEEEAEEEGEEEVPQPDDDTMTDDELADEENEAAYEMLRSQQEAALAAIETALEDQLDLVAAQPAEPDAFYRVNSGGADVQQLVGQFMDEYAQEMSGMSLRAGVIQVLQAKKTKPRPEVQDKELDTNGRGGLDVDFVDEAVATQFQILLLLNYSFQSSMLEEKRPYVSVLRLTMDCSASADDCQVLEHVDLPRHNESTSSVSSELQRAIFSSAPAEFTDGQSATKVLYDAVETQFLDEDDQSPTADVVRYVRFRVAGGTAQDCMVVVQQTGNLNLLLYADNVCYKDAANALAAAGGASKENFPLFVFIAACTGAAVALLVLRYRRKYQRSGYSYVHSKPGMVPGSILSDDVAATA